MKYYELKIKVDLKKDFHFTEIGEAIGNLLKGAMKNNDYLSSLHESHKPKLYVYDYLYPRPKNKIYKGGNRYFFTFRTPVEETAKSFFRSLIKHSDSNFNVVFVDYKTHLYNPSFNLYTSTPAVCTLGDKYWKHEDGILKIKEQMEKNLVKKYEMLYGHAPDVQDGFLSVTAQNKTFVKLKYKKGFVIGNKFSLDFKPNDDSIKMEFLAYTTALLEKSSSLGTGFCIEKKK